MPVKEEWDSAEPREGPFHGLAYNPVFLGGHMKGMDTFPCEMIQAKGEEL